MNHTTSDDGDSFASLKVCDGIRHPSAVTGGSSGPQPQSNNGDSQSQANGGQEIPETGPMSAERIFWFNNNLNINNNNQVTLDLKVRNIGRKKWKNV